MAHRYRAATVALLRAPALSPADLPPWPELSERGPDRAAQWIAWLRGVWGQARIAEALAHASPALAESVDAVCHADAPDVARVRRAVMATARYLLRMTSRPVPFGLLAGAGLAWFGDQPAVRWGADHRVVAHASGEWLEAVISKLEKMPGLLPGLRVVTNSAAFVRGDWIVIPYRSASGAADAEPVEVSVRYTAPVQKMAEGARAPVRARDLVASVLADFPGAPPAAASRMLAELVAAGVLTTSLHAPGTEPAALRHVAAELAEADPATMTAPLITAVRAASELLDRHNQAPHSEAGLLRQQTTARMRDAVPTRRHPLSLDLMLDATVVLPGSVAREAERAAIALTRLSADPAGPPAWRDYHARFLERYGVGALVPLLDVVSDGGIGWPDGYPGVAPELPRHLTDRDRTLLTLAQAAALDGQDEIVVDKRLIADLESRDVRLRPPPHLELGLRVRAACTAALGQGEYLIEVTVVSRGAGVLTGRFLPALPPDQADCLVGAIGAVPCADAATEAVQLSFPPRDPAAAQVTRAPQILPRVLSVSEHRKPSEKVLTVGDLAVGCDAQRMYLAVPGCGKRVEASAMHALDLESQAPPLARLVSQLSRAGCTRVTMFDWGAAAGLPFLPRLRMGRVILAPARWRLDAKNLLQLQDLRALLTRRRVPDLVHVADSDQHLALDLHQSAHLTLLRTQLEKKGSVVLTEAPQPTDLGWSAGRVIEVIVPLTTGPPSSALLPAPRKSLVVRRDHGDLPAISPVLLACLYGDPRRQDLILAGYLPRLLEALGDPSGWWFIRYRDPAHHLRIRVPLADLSGYGDTAKVVSTWANELRRAGLLSDIRYPAHYAETGRWGSGQARVHAEAVFHADSRAVVTQLSVPDRPGKQALAAAHAAAIATAFCGSTATGMRWLLDHVPAAAPVRIPRPLLDEARRLVRPDDGPDGGACAARDRAVAAYRGFISERDCGVSLDYVLRSLLHVNFIRACAIDPGGESVVLHLARSAALAWANRQDRVGDHR